MNIINEIRNISVANKRRIVLALNLLLILSVVLFYQAGMYDRIVLAAFTFVYVNTILKNSIRPIETYDWRKYDFRG